MVSPSLIPYLSCTFHPDCALLFHLCQIRHYYSNSFSIFRNSTSFTEANAYTGTQLKDSYALYGIFISLWGLTPMFHFWCHGTKLSKLYLIGSDPRSWCLVCGIRWSGSWKRMCWYGNHYCHERAGTSRSA